MKKFLALVVLFTCGWGYADAQRMGGKREPSLMERVMKIEKKTDAFNLYLNTQASFNGYFGQGGKDGMSDYLLGPAMDQDMNFRFNQLRIEAMGNITDRIFYRYRQRLNRPNNAQSLDNVPNSLDYAAVGFRFTPDFYMFAGKQCAAFGGFEFDLNPIEIYQYSDIIEYMSNYMTGIEFGYDFLGTQQVKFQVLNSLNGSFLDQYGYGNGDNLTLADLKRAKVPLGYVLNWNGNFFDDVWQTRWSASVMHQTEFRNWFYYAIGNQVNFGKFNMFFDFMWSNEGVDRTGIMTGLMNNVGLDATALDTRYMSLVYKCNFRVLPELNLFVKGMYETANLRKDLEISDEGYLEKGKYRTAWGYIGGVEYYPVENSNLHFFLTYIGRSIDYTSKASSFSNINPQRMELGFVYKIPVF
ncbi:MAG: porin [Marinifilaceae bacterium]